MSSNNYSPFDIREYLFGGFPPSSTLTIDHVRTVIDKYGFRNSHNYSQSNIVALGCSDTFGIGTTYNNTWVSLVSNFIGKKINNLGFPGGSLKTCYRLLCGYIEKGYKVKEVYMLGPSIFRDEAILQSPDGSYRINLMPQAAEVFEEEDGPSYLVKYIDDHFKYNLSVYENCVLNYRVLLDAIEKVCTDNNIKLYSFYNPCYGQDYSKVVNHTILDYLRRDPHYDRLFKIHSKELALDNKHLGPWYQKYIADRFINLKKLDSII